jgi:phytoene desaturase
VVGAGIGGLSAAALLAKAGCAVDLYERRQETGGKAASIQLGGYRFDTGPSLFTMPWVFDDFFAALGERREDRFRIIPLEPICNYFYSDGTRLSAYEDEKRFGSEIEAKTRSTAAELGRYLRSARRLWSVAGDLFLRHSLHEASTYLSRSGLWSIARLPLLDPFRTLHGANAAAFADPRITQLFDRYATYNGSDPFKTPATMRIVPHVEYQWGGWAVAGGIVSVPRAMEAAARDAGVRFHLGQEVEEIVTEVCGGRGGQRGGLRRSGEFGGGDSGTTGDGAAAPGPGDTCRVRGIRVGGVELDYDIVLSNADVLSTYRRLLKAPDAPEAKRYEKLEPSSSGLVFLWGIGRRFDQLSSNNIFFSSDYRREFSCIFDQGLLPDDPTIYINITSKTCAEDAPAGGQDARNKGENWFVLINAPKHAGQDWTAMAAQARAAALKRLSQELGADIEPLIEAERCITPEIIERETGSTYGSLYGIASNDRSAAFLRHPNRSARIKGLYFAGGSAHPGGGMPLALLSGTIAAQLVLKYGAE